jgi:hypothetical protein
LPVLFPGRALAALAVLSQAALARHRGAVAASALGLFALAFADVTGASYASSGDAADSMGMAVLTGAALLCYAANLYLLRRPAFQDGTTGPPYEDGTTGPACEDGTTGPPYEAGTTGAGKSRV